MLDSIRYGGLAWSFDDGYRMFGFVTQSVNILVGLVVVLLAVSLCPVRSLCWFLGYQVNKYWPL